VVGVVVVEDRIVFDGRGGVDRVVGKEAGDEGESGDALDPGAAQGGVLVACQPLDQAGEDG